MKIKGRLLSGASLLAMGALLLGATSTSAQDKKVGLYAGYAYLNTDGGNLHGVRLSPEYRLNSFAALVGDLSWEKGTISSTSTTVITYLGGVRLNRGVGSMGLFAHVLAGGVRTSTSVKPFGGVNISVSDSDLALDGGGGVEFKFRGSLKMRIGADYLRRKVDVGGGNSRNVNDVRGTVGFVF